MRQYFYHIITFGCQMNKSDSERLAALLQAMGLAETASTQEADLILINTCSVRQSAEDRVHGLCANFFELKKRKPSLIIGVTGCMPGRDKDGRIKNKLNGADFYFPIHQMVRLPQWLASLNPELINAGDLAEDYLALRPIYENSFQAFVPIQTGCDHFCSYCVVPQARGAEGNRPLKQILDEIRSLAENGCLEITLLGQIINHYIAPDPEYFSARNPYKKNDFAKLLWELNQASGIERIHWTAAHPIYMDEEAIDALTLPKQVNFLHLPVQSGNTEILRKMNRRHDREFYLNLIKKVRQKKPGIAIGTDIIVGFCGETEAQFEDTVSLYKECDFDISYPAQYSERPGTLAARQFKDDVPKSEKKRRWQAIQDLMEEIVFKKNQSYIWETVSVLAGEFTDGYCWGYSQEMKLTRFPGRKDIVGTIQPVRIKLADTWLLTGKSAGVD